MHAPTPSSAVEIAQENPDAGLVADRFSIWLASPMARSHFDPARLNARDARRSESIRNPVRAEEFTISRSLLQYVAVSAAASKSLSHSGRYAALALAPAGTAVGVDIEQHRARDVLSIARFAFAPEESAALEGLQEAALERAFYTRWVLKEALAKALQLPLLAASRECRFFEEADGWRGSVPDSRSWQVHAYEPFPGMSLAVAFVGASAPVVPQIYEWPPPRLVIWKSIAAAASPAEKPALLEESSTCRAMLPTL